MMVKGNTAVGKEEPPEHQQSFPLTAQRMNLQDRFASGTGYRTEGVLGNAGTHGMSSSAGTFSVGEESPKTVGEIFPSECARVLVHD